MPIAVKTMEKSCWARIHGLPFGWDDRHFDEPVSKVANAPEGSPGKVDEAPVSNEPSGGSPIGHDDLDAAGSIGDPEDGSKRVEP